MLSGMIARLLLKALLSLVVLLGMASYGMYLSGGDPQALWQRLAAGALDSVGESADRVGERMSAPARALTGRDEPAGQVWTWRDADGLAHYANAPPDGVEATPIRLAPDVNVLAPLPKKGPTGLSVSPPGAGDEVLRRASGLPSVEGRVRPGAEASGEPLPGIGGAISRARGDAPPPDPARAEALLRLLQTPAR